MQETEQDKGFTQEASGGDRDGFMLPELVAHLREGRTALRQEWATRITDAHLLSSMTSQEVFSCLLYTSPSPRDS